MRPNQRRDLPTTLAAEGSLQMIGIARGQRRTTTRRTMLIAVVLLLATLFTHALAQKTINVATRVDVANVDLHMTTNFDDRNPLLTVYEFLIGIDGNGAPAPMLAESWAWSDDGLTLTIPLRQGVLFHNGEEMTSEDVKYSLDRVRT